VKVGLGTSSSVSSASHRGAGERRLAGAEIPRQRHDVARPQRGGEIFGEQHHGCFVREEALDDRCGHEATRPPS
jgi:hypothetical protein